MTTLIPCPECNRHVRRTENLCPFCQCGVAAAAVATPERPMPTVRLGRAALLAFAAASAAGTACGGETLTAPPKARDAGPESGASENGGAGSGGRSSNTGGFISAPPYGIPPSSGGQLNTGGFAQPYGIPPGFGGSAGSAGAPAYDCIDLLSGGVPSRCCPKPLPDCTNKPHGYPGYGCSPEPKSYCSCMCSGGAWVCGC